VSIENPVAPVNLQLEKTIEGERAKIAHLVEEARLVEAARKVEDVNFVAISTERNRQNSLHHHGCSAIWNSLFKGEFEQEEVGYTGAIVPSLLPVNAKFD
ncbi:hypothetical protein HAX54_027917, partial [Datura stramonium]|nr:hypothetical protein [Datura stramonium]